MTRAEAAETIGEGTRAVGGAVGGVGEAGLGCLPSEGASTWMSSTGLRVLVLWALFLSMAFFLPPSPIVGVPRAGKLCSSLRCISTRAMFLSSSSLAKRCSSVKPKEESTVLTDLLVFPPACSSPGASGGHDCCFITRPLEPSPVTAEEDARVCFPRPLPLPSQSPCPLPILFSRLATTLQLLASLVGGRRFQRGTSFWPKSSL